MVLQIFKGWLSGTEKPTFACQDTPKVGRDVFHVAGTHFTAI